MIALLTVTLCVAEQQHLNSNVPLDPLSINDLAKKPSAKLDPKLRKALLKVLTRLDEEDKQVGGIEQSGNQQQQITLNNTPVSTSLLSSIAPNNSKEIITLLPPPSAQPDDTKVNNNKFIEKLPTNVSGSQIDFFQVPLLAAFTLQDFNGIPRSAIPIYTELEQLERQNIQFLKTKKEARGKENSIDNEANNFFQHNQQTGKLLLPTVNLPQNINYQQQLTFQQFQEQQAQSRPRFVEPRPTQQSIQQQHIQPQSVQNNIIQPQKFEQHILRPNQQQAFQNQMIQSDQNQLQFNQQQTVQYQFSQPQNNQIELYRQQFVQPNALKNQFSHVQIIPSQQYKHFQQWLQPQQIQSIPFDQQQLFQQRQTEFRPEHFTQQIRVLRQPQEEFEYRVTVPKLPDDLNVVYKVLALNHEHRIL
ncbi:bromodomain-containing protein DDB_G0280777-like isoform X2 [Daktulosphaira vitifoliae]|nr:bromodomain-containing protein DDB_G0280777-like isoform X2 [Daktulosphaira vitifoliae]XP_050545496.1 bromodomain-containing protein DDB_G0280777-like isoform X2 [Daktulosphaira vitifoliae]